MDTRKSAEDEYNSALETLMEMEGWKADADGNLVDAEGKLVSAEQVAAELEQYVVNLSKERKTYLKKLRKKKTIILISQILILVGFISIWELLANKGIMDSFITSKPSRILDTFMNLTSNDLLKETYSILAIAYKQYKKDTNCASKEAKAAPMIPQENTNTNRQSRPIFNSAAIIIATSGVFPSPRPRRIAEVRL